MKKNKLFIVLLAFVLVFNLLFTACDEEDNPIIDEGPVGLITEMGVGWNLGNTLDAGGTYNENQTVQQMETNWVSTVTTQETINTIKNAGFNTIRIPVTWTKSIAPADRGNVSASYKIREDWMARVKEIVDYAVNNDMYIILNIHHDNGLFPLDDDRIEISKNAIEKVWQQIAETFKDYDEKLIFESLNEPRTSRSAAEWTGGTAVERNNLNILNQVFVDTIRASGGNNGHRILLIPTYAASALQVAMRGLKMPEDTIEDKIMVSVHAYVPNSFALNNGGTSVWSSSNQRDIQEVMNTIDAAHQIFVSQGIPVIMGEFGARNRSNEDARADYAEYYVKYAKENGIVCVWWDNGVLVEPSASTDAFGILDRTNNTFPFPKIIAALMRGIQ